MSTSQTQPDDLSDFTREIFTSSPDATPGPSSKPVYWIGSGPGIIVIPEMPGLTPEVADFARRVAADGFTCAVPSLFGQPGRPETTGYIVQSMARACVSKEFAAFATGATSPVTGWLRALSVEVHERCGGAGIGVVGMCFTGGFALGMMVDPTVRVPVLSQPSLPLPAGKRQRSAIGVSAADLAAARNRTLTDDVCVLGLRFTGDSFAPTERFARLREALGDGFIGVEIDSSEGNAYGFDKDAHSVLTREFVDEPGHPTREAYDLILDHFRRKLR